MLATQASVGTLRCRIVRTAAPHAPPSLVGLLAESFRGDISVARKLRRFPRILPGWCAIALMMVASAITSLPFAYGALYGRILKADGTVINTGLESLRVVTDVAATDIVDNLRGSASDIGSFKYHGIGTGSTAEAAGDTALVTELTTQYNPDSTRATGTQTNNGAKVYRTVATNTVDAGCVIAEHGIFSSATSGAGKLWDRSLVGPYTLVSGDGFQSTYDYTVVSGG